MTRKQIIKHYKDHFGLQDIPFRMLASGDKATIEWAEDLVKNCLIADVVGSLPALSADFENIIGRSYPIKDSEPSKYFETLKHAGNECAEWVHHKIKVSRQ